MSLIEIKNLNFSYQDNDYAINNLNLNIEEGSFVCILGHNGSGKSTLAKLLLGLLKSNSGEITIDGITLNEETVYKIRKKIGIVFQNPDNQFVGATVRHDIAFGLENLCIERNKMKEMVLEFIKKVGMDEYLDYEPMSLSGGQKQRVAIASMLAMNPQIMVFDEATSMLDPEGSNEVISLINNLKKEKRTIIAITHDLNFALEADRIIVLKEGNIILDDKPLEIFKKSSLLKTAKLNLPMALEIKENINKKDMKELLWQYVLKM